MPSVDLVVRCEVPQSARVRQLEGMFDVPPAQYSERRWSLEAPIEERDWSVGLIVGPSGAGKSTIAREMFGDLVDSPLKWSASSVIDDFDPALSMQQISSICSAVGFNTIPAWRQPFSTLSNGERFRVSLARRLAEIEDIVVVDEFTSVVDRQVAKIGSHAVQKHVRRTPGKRFVAVTCHLDVEDWLQPDWVIEPAVERFRWRSLQRRPSLDVRVAPVDYAAWQLFAPYHYLTASLNKAARCYGLFVDDQIAAFAGVLHRPHPKTKNIKGVSRLVTLPDFQGLGLAFVLVDAIAAQHRRGGFELRTYPAHPALVRNFARSKLWKMTKKAGSFSGAIPGPNSTVGGFGGRPCAVFKYVGPPAERSDLLRSNHAA